MSSLHDPKKILHTIKNVITPTGDVEADKQRAEQYSKIVGMDSANSKMMEVACTKGIESARDQMISQFTDEKGHFDYAAMRGMYG